MALVDFEIGALVLVGMEEVLVVVGVLVGVEELGRIEGFDTLLGSCGSLKSLHCSSTRSWDDLSIPGCMCWNRGYPSSRILANCVNLAMQSFLHTRNDRA